MKKVIAISILCLLFMAGFLISYFSYVNNFYWLLIIVILLYAVFFLSVLGLLKYRTYMNSRIIDPKRHLKRNYERIYLGIQSKESADENTLDLRGYHRNFYVDSLLVQRYYSFLKSGGTITIFASNNKHYLKDRWICPLDYPLLHPVTLMENGIKPPKYLLFNPLIGMLFLWMKVFGSKRKERFSIDKKATIFEFCKARDVIIEII